MGGILLLGLALALAGCACFYLASPHQGLLRAPWPAKPARVGGGLLLACSLADLGLALRVLPAVFLFCAGVMAFLMLLPYVSALAVSLRIR
ncbi:hypothetical protein [Geothrix sp. 21YS21S-4]|uniref:hypothetical protein n=1 Tax=Geothrix sp. 21YS21S-4 TaxID=3068889 RepID=UPI0027BAD244|nr:hypothetical protein [Geothrix sp. 21YS21S-4]